MKKIISLILAIALLMGVSAFAETAYSDTETVKAVQTALNDLGFPCGTPDGKAGKKTIAAIQEFQTANEMEPSGVIDDALLKALKLIEEYEAEITFQNIPWLSQQDEVLQMIKDAGIIEGIFGSGLQAVVWPENVMDFLDFNNRPALTLDYGINAYTHSDIKIGGYIPDGISWSFMYDLSENPTKENGNERLYGIRIIYKNESGVNITEDTSLLDDLTEKLSSVYGKGKEIAFSFYDYNLKGTVWYGQNETGVCIYQDWSDDTVNIYYGKTNGYQLRDNNEAVLEAQKEKMDNLGF